MKLQWILLVTLLGVHLGFAQDSSAQRDPHTNVNAAFPEIHDWNTLRITLSRSGCYGRCPVYKVEIHGDGTVLYDGKVNVASLKKDLEFFKEFGEVTDAKMTVEQLLDMSFVDAAVREARALAGLATAQLSTTAGG